jgi:integrase
MAIKVTELRALKAGNLMRDGKPVEWLPDDSKRGSGTLLFRAVGGIVRGYFRYAPETGKRDTLAIGQWDEKGGDGLTLEGLRAKADEWRRLYQSGVKDIRGHLGAKEQAQIDTKRAAEVARQEAGRKAMERAKFTLGALCAGYAGMLEGRGKIASAKHAASMFKHVPDDLAGLPANEITSHQIAAIIRQVRESGKERAAGILRAYLRAAYGAAIRAPFDSELPASLIPFNVEVNPVDAVPAIAVRAGNRTLSRVELRAYLEALGEGIIDQALMLALLAGGQRMAQLLRVRVADWDQGAQTLRLWDGKGKRADPREHLLPLGPRAAALVEGLIQRAGARSDDPNPSLFLSTGKAQVVESTPGKRVSGIAASMKGEPFDLRDIRRTVETLMAGLGINRDTRAQLMSHGLSGVQAVHYDRHGYMDEKRRALIAWESSLFASDESNVVKLKRKRSA